jgi:hypothetical protein
MKTNEREIEDPEVKPHSYSHLIFYKKILPKSPKHVMEKRQLFQQTLGKTGYSYL